MAVLTEKLHAGAFIVSEEDNRYSRDAIIVASGAGKLVAGTVLGKITASGKYIPALAGASDGSQNVAGVLFDGVDATSADAQGVIVNRVAQVRLADLTVDASLTATVAAKLALIGVIVR